MYEEDQVGVCEDGSGECVGVWADEPDVCVNEPSICVCVYWVARELHRY